MGHRCNSTISSDRSCLGSVEQCTPRSRGYLAGLSIAPGADMEGSSFEEAFQLLGHVDEGLLSEYEQDLWHEERLQFVFATKQVSVIDSAIGAEEYVRLLVRNSEPRLVQTAVPIDKMGAQSPPFPARSPLFGQYGTHMGGLALAVPLWCASDRKSAKADISQPRVLVIGGGGGSIPRTIAAALPAATVDVVELCPDTRRVARECFGLRELESTGLLQLHGGCGAEHLMSIEKGSVDVLIIDAAGSQEEGLHAPPLALRSPVFWAAVAHGLALPGQHSASTWWAPPRQWRY